MQHSHFIKTASSPEPSAEEDNKEHQLEHLASISWITAQTEVMMKTSDEPRE